MKSKFYPSEGFKTLFILSHAKSFSMCLSILLFAFLKSSSSYGQLSPDPAYQPVTPDYIELEQCDESGNEILLIYSEFYADSLLDPNDYSTQCMEYLPLPSNPTSFVLQGSANLTHGIGMPMDNYEFELEEEVLVDFFYQKSHLFATSVTLRSLPENFPSCGAPASASIDTLGLGTVIAEMYYDFFLGGTLTESVLLPPGRYWINILTIPNSDYPTECPIWEYQLKMDFHSQADIPGQFCSTAIELIPEETFNESRLMDDMSDGLYHGNFSCATADIGQTERWFKFTAAKSHSFIQARREGAGNFDGVIEVYSSCGNLIQCTDDYVGANEIAIVPTQPGLTYYYRIYHKGHQALNNTAISTAVAYVPPTQLRSQDCGRMNLTPNDIIRSDWPSNQFLLSNWRFLFIELEAPYAQYEILSPNGSNPQFRMHWFPQAEPGRTYMVLTRPRMYQGPTWGDYADWCVIGMAPAPIWDQSSTDHLQVDGSSQSMQEASLQLWPNPARGAFRCSFEVRPGDSDYLLSVFDVSGKMVHQSTGGLAHQGLMEIEQRTESFASGLYMVQVQTASAVYSAKLMIE